MKTTAIEREAVKYMPEKPLEANEKQRKAMLYYIICEDIV